MIHVIRQIERRLPPSQRRTFVPRLLLASALALALGTGLLVAAESRAQEAPAEAEAPAFDAVREAVQVIDAFLAGDTASVHARFDATMAAAVSAEQLAQGLASIQAGTGALQSRGEPTMDQREGGALVTQSLRFERAELVALVAFDKDRRIAGFALRPPKAPAAEVPPVPADAMYEESELRIGDAATGLPATLAMPKGKGPFPAVVLVHGSGPQDRHSTIGPNRPFLDIARGLAERGIAVLRYEKRTKAQPQAFTADGGGTIDRETTDDALLAVQALRALPGVNAKRVFVLGHSLGGMMAPRIAQRDPKIAGIVLLAAPSRPLLDILVEQNKRLAVLDDGRVSEQENATIMRLSDSVKAVRDGREMTAAQGPLGLSPEYWRTVEAVDPVAEAAQIKQPMLILQGARDIQVVDADWQNWRAAFHDDARVTFKLYEALNHLAIPGEGDGSVAEYTRAGHVAPELIADVAAWIEAQPASTSPARSKTGR